jgi:type II secretion system protein L
VKIIGLKIEKGSLAVSVVMKTFRQIELTESYIVSFVTDAELADILRQKAKDWVGARIVSSIPGSFFAQRTLSFPFADRKRLEKALPFELEDSVPFDLGDTVVDHVVLEGIEKSSNGAQKNEATVLAMMLPKQLLRQHLELLASAGVDPQVIVPSYLGLHAVARMIPSEGPTMLLAGKDLCLKQGGAVRSIRSFSPAPTGGFDHTLKALETECREKVEKAVVLDTDGTAEAQAAELGLSVDRVVPEFHGKKPADAVSLGLALLEDVNFRRGEFAFRVADEGTRRRKRALAIAGGAAALMAVINFGVKVYVVESAYGKLIREIEAIYRQTFPDAKVAGDPVRLMRGKIDEARKKFGVLGSGASALDAMKAVTEGVPKEVRVSFQDFVLEGERLRLQGEATSFEAVDKIKAELQKAGPFSDVIVQDTRMGVENKVKFRMELKLKQAF